LKPTQRLAISLAVGLFAGALVMRAEQVTVTAERVNIRSVPNLQGEKMGQVARGDVLSATGERRDGWLEIVPPASAAVWIYGELVAEGVVAASSVRVRSGPGVGYRAVGSLHKGDRVEAVGSKGDWIRIVPPSSSRAWIAEEYVAAGSGIPAVKPAVSKPKPKPAASKPKPKPKPVVRIQPAPVVRTPCMPDRPSAQRASGSRQIVPVRTDVDATRPAAKPSTVAKAPQVKISPKGVESLHLVAGAPQGESAEVTGVLLRTGLFPLGRPGRYRLVMSGGRGPARTACYVIGDDGVLAARVNERVTLAGKKYWVQGVREPVVAVSAVSGE
jgi:hypothetical protein